jgi:hypothetical protein
MLKGKKFISPGNWFSMLYPADWNEFTDSSDDFLFYNPEIWNGNFRISAFREDNSDRLGDDSCDDELKNNKLAKKVIVGSHTCAYSKEYFEEEGQKYITHLWIFGKGDTAIQCSFTAFPETDIIIAGEIISSVTIHRRNEKFPMEIIPIRLSEIEIIDEAYKWVTELVKSQLTINFQGLESDLEHIQESIAKANLSVKKRDYWINLGITLCCILTNEIDGLEWKTMIDGNREDPVLIYRSEQLIDPLKLFWSKIKRGEECSVVAVYKDLLDSLNS